MSEKSVKIRLQLYNRTLLSMRKILTLFILCLSIQICLAQNPFKTGFTVEGGYYYPETSKYLKGIKDGYSTGIGFWVMKEFHPCFSVDVGLTFRKKTYQQPMDGYYNLDRTEYTYIESWPLPEIRFNQDLLVIPLHVRFYPTRKFFITGGVEHAFMINLDANIKKDWEDNWLVGIGGDQPWKLNWSLTYAKGFHKRGLKAVEGERMYSSVYTNRMIQLSLFYPIWKKK